MVWECNIYHLRLPQTALVELCAYSVMSDSLWPLDCTLPDSSVHGISQARILEWVPISYSQEIFPTQGSNPWLLVLGFSKVVKTSWESAGGGNV